MNHDWQTLRNQFIRNVGGDLPGAQLEQELIDAYTQHPTAVERSIEKITLGHKAGKIRSPWGALKAEVAKAVIAANNPRHDTGTTRETAIAHAEQWVRAAGYHYDRETELVDELYGDRGQLRAHLDTQPRLTKLWDELAPLGALVEQEAIERGIRYQQQRAALQEALADPKTKARIQAGNLEIRDGIEVQPHMSDDDIPF